MADSVVGRYWCYECHQIVNANAVIGAELKCPSCDSCFVEEMGGGEDSRTDRSAAFWGPMLFRMWADSLGRSRARTEDEGDDDEEDEEEEGTDMDREFEELVRRRRRSSAVLQALQSLYFDDRLAPDEFLPHGLDDGEGFVVVGALDRALVIRWSLNLESLETDGGGEGSGSGVAMGDYFLGPGLELFLQHLAENDPSRYGTPPAKKEAVEALPAVTVGENVGCSVCLEDIESGTEGREMPCKHKFHGQCILPWLELHSSCPLCRFQLPSEESKVPVGGGGRDVEDEEGGGDDGSAEFSFPVPWPFNLLGASGTEIPISSPLSSASSSTSEDSEERSLDRVD